MDRNDVRKTQALWYAWGHEDSGVKLAGDAFAFATAYAERYAAYDAERVCYMESMRTAFEKWQSGADMMDDVRQAEAERAARAARIAEVNGR